MQQLDNDPGPGRPVIARIPVADLALRPAVTDLGGLLRRLGGLGANEIAQIRALPLVRSRWRAGANLLPDPRGAPLHIVLAGWASRQRVLRDGRRLILDFAVAGDGFGRSAGAEEPLREKIMALTPVETVNAEALLTLAEESGPQSALARALKAMRREDQARMLDHMVRLGRLTAAEKLAHFLLEMQRRTVAPDAAGPRGFRLPLTQEAIGDALGLSVVHVNRVLRQLRVDGLIAMREGLVWIPEPEKLAALAVLEQLKGA
jgi:CRP-like cAMP-binding protein